MLSVSERNRQRGDEEQILAPSCMHRTRITSYIARRAIETNEKRNGHTDAWTFGGTDVRRNRRSDARWQVVCISGMGVASLDVPEKRGARVLVSG